MYILNLVATLPVGVLSSNVLDTQYDKMGSGEKKSKNLFERVLSLIYQVPGDFEGKNKPSCGNTSFT